MLWLWRSLLLLLLQCLQLLFVLLLLLELLKLLLLLLLLLDKLLNVQVSFDTLRIAVKRIVVVMA